MMFRHGAIDHFLGNFEPRPTVRAPNKVFAAPLHAATAQLVVRPTGTAAGRETFSFGFDSSQSILLDTADAAYQSISRL
jgi:hypothetical protein